MSIKTFWHFFSTARDLAATPEIVGQLCPHLSQAEVKEIIEEAKSKKSSYFFAAPPILTDEVVGVAGIHSTNSDNELGNAVYVSFNLLAATGVIH